MARYLAGFDDTNHTRQLPGLPNHVAWNLGHCALTMHRVAERLDGRSLPERDFVTGGRKDGGGDAQRFSVESVAFGSTPSASGREYPTMTRCREIYESACDRLSEAVRLAPESKLDEMTPWGAGQTMPLYLLALRMMFHNGDHLGQIVDLRRGLGFTSIFA
jgi:hypothetical protein